MPLPFGKNSESSSYEIPLFEDENGQHQDKECVNHPIKQRKKIIFREDGEAMDNFSLEIEILQVRQDDRKALDEKPQRCRFCPLDEGLESPGEMANQVKG